MGPAADLEALMPDLTPSENWAFMGVTSSVSRDGMRYLLLVMLMGCSGSSKPETPPKPGDPVRGATIYRTHCAVCHQTDGSGAPQGGRPIAGSFVGEGSVLAQSDAVLLRAIAYGKTGRIGSMPGWAGILSKTERRDVLAHLRKTFGTAPK